MVQIGENRPWSLWSMDPRVRISVISSTLCTATALLAIALTIRWLDRDLPWRKKLVARAFAQLILCTILPALLIAGWQFLFFYYMDATHHMVGYLEDDFPVVISMLLIWNLFYPVCYYYSVPRRTLPAASESQPRPSHDSVPTESSDFWTERVALFTTEGKITWAHLFDGTLQALDRPLQHYADWLAGPHFHMARRGNLVNRKAIVRVTEADRYYTLTLQSLHVNSPTEVNTRMDHKRAFRAWWKGDIERKSTPL